MTETISLDLAKRFKEAGIELRCKNEYIKYKHFRKSGRSEKIVIYQPTAQELRDRLPERIIDEYIHEIRYIKILKRNNNKTFVVYINEGKEAQYCGTTDCDTLAESLGEMYLYLHNNNLLGPKKQ